MWQCIDTPLPSVDKLLNTRITKQGKQSAAVRLILASRHKACRVGTMRRTELNRMRTVSRHKTTRKCKAHTFVSRNSSLNVLIAVQMFTDCSARMLGSWVRVTLQVWCLTAFFFKMRLIYAQPYKTLLLWPIKSEPIHCFKSLNLYSAGVSLLSFSANCLFHRQVKH